MRGWPGDWAGVVLACCVGAAGAGSGSAARGAGGEPAPAESSTVIYDRDFFARYTVTTAEDILRRIPGVAAILDDSLNQDNKRGFGSSGDQILIDGRRLAAKSNDVNGALRRIQSSNVERVELIRGTSSDVDVLSEGVIVNIVLREGAERGGMTTWQVRARFNDAGSFDVDGVASYNNRWGRLNYLLGFERSIWSPGTGGLPYHWTDRVREERYFYPNGALQEWRPQEWARGHDKYIFTVNLNYDFENGDQLRLNGLLEPLDVTEDQDIPLTRFAPDGSVALNAAEIYRRHMDDRLKWEIGGEYRKGVGPGMFNLLFVYNNNDQPVLEFRNLELVGATREISRNVSQQVQDEGIVRGSYNWPLAVNQSVELGLEAVRNVLDQSLVVSFDRNQDGLVEPVDFPTAIARVKELRGEAFVTHNWTITERLTLESSLIAEYSSISHNFDFAREPSYFFLKPRADFRYSLTERDQLRLKIERTVSQLDLPEFVPKFDFVDSEIDAGNPSLAPETAWVYEIRYEHRMAGDNGVIEARAFYEDFQDHIDKLVIGVDSDGDLVAASGNIESARNYGAEIKGSVRLAFVGLRDVVIDGRFLRQYPQTTDPFSGAKRGMREALDYEASFGFRHDMTLWGMSYGASYSDRGGAFPINDIRESGFLSFGPLVDAFIEKKIFGGMTLRLDGYGLLKSKEYRSRTLYLDDAIAGTVLRTERYKEIRDRRFSLSLRGTF